MKQGMDCKIWGSHDSAVEDSKLIDSQFLWNSIVAAINFD